MVLRPVLKHSKFLGFLKVTQESEMQILFQNCMLDQFVLLHTAKFLL